jgi:hypothetical protein
MILIIYSIILKLGFRLEWLVSIIAAYAVIYVLLIIGCVVDSNLNLNIIFWIGVIGLVAVVLGVRNLQALKIKLTIKDAALIVLLVLFLFFASRRVELMWDEYSHWGYSIRYINDFGALPSIAKIPREHGAIWYPWGLAVYSGILGYGFPVVAKINLPIVVNGILLIHISRIYAGMVPSIRNGGALLIAALIGVEASSLLLSGYADFSLNASLLLSVGFLYKLLHDDDFKNSCVGLFAASIMSISIKESGVYLLAISFMAFAFFFHRDIRRDKSIKLALTGLAVVLLAIVFLWRLHVLELSSIAGREMGLWTRENLKFDNTWKFFRSAALLIKGHLILYASIFLIFFFATIRPTPSWWAFSVSDQIGRLKGSLILFSLLNFLFVVLSYYLTFGTGEFINASSFDRYMKLSFFLVVISIFLGINFPALADAHWAFAARCIPMLLLVGATFYVYDRNKGNLRVQDTFPKSVANQVDRTVPKSENIFYIDSGATQGLHPIKINWLLAAERKLGYSVIPIRDGFKLSEISIPNNMNYLMLIEKLNYIECYKISPQVHVVAESSGNDYGVFYAWGERRVMESMIEERRCLK